MRLLRRAIAMSAGAARSLSTSRVTGLAPGPFAVGVRTIQLTDDSRQEDGAEPEPEAPRPRFQSKYRKIERSGSAPGDALMAAAKGGSFKGSANAVLAVARTSQLARSQVSANG